MKGDVLGEVEKMEKIPEFQLPGWSVYVFIICQLTGKRCAIPDSRDDLFGRYRRCSTTAAVCGVFSLVIQFSERRRFAYLCECVRIIVWCVHKNSNVCVCVVGVEYCLNNLDNVLAINVSLLFHI